MHAAVLKQWLVGTPLPTAEERQQRLSKTLALAVFSSDALSSVAYATEEILFVLILAGAAALSWSLPIGTAIIALLIIVTTSYWQTIHAYPGGGGSYIVAMENLGTVAGQAAGAALMIDYILTVSVSVAATSCAVRGATAPPRCCWTRWSCSNAWRRSSPPRAARCWPTTASWPRMPRGARRWCARRRPETSGGRGCPAIPRPRKPRAGGRGRGSYAGCSRSTSSCARAVPARAESWAP
jgi:hypothetical protein